MTRRTEYLSDNRRFDERSYSRSNVQHSRCVIFDTSMNCETDLWANVSASGLLVFPEMTSTNGKAVVSFEEKLVCCRKAAMSVKTFTMLTSEEEVHRNVPEGTIYLSKLKHF